MHEMKVSGSRGYKEMKGNKHTVGKKSQLRSIRIDMADNGYTVQCQEEMEGKEPVYHEPSRYVFGSADEVADFVKEKLGGSHAGEK